MTLRLKMHLDVLIRKETFFQCNFVLCLNRKYFLIVSQNNRFLKKGLGTIPRQDFELLFEVSNH